MAEEASVVALWLVVVVVVLLLLLVLLLAVVQVAPALAGTVALALPSQLGGWCRYQVQHGVVAL